MTFTPAINIGGHIAIDMSESDRISPDELRAHLDAVGVDLHDGRTASYADLKHNQNLNAMAIGLGLDQVEYEPERFPGLVYRPEDVAATVIVFANGELVVPDADTEEDGERAISDAVAQLLNIGLLDEHSDPDPSFGTDIEIRGPTEGFGGADTADAVDEPDDSLDTTDDSATLDESNESADDLSKESSCRSCGAELTGDENFCPECGTEVHPSCSGCGASLTGDENFCPECGTATAG